MNRRNGFTLIELMIVIAVAAVLLSVAVPSFQETVRNNRLAANVNEVISALNMARSEAIKRGAPVTVCKGTAAGCNTAAAWENGWVVFADGAGNIGTIDSGTGTCLPTEDCLLRVYTRLSANYSLDGDIAVTDRVTYNTRGMSAAGTLVMCDERGFGQHARAIAIARTGRVQTQSASSLGSCQI